MAVGCHSCNALVAKLITRCHHQVMVPIVFPRVFRRPMTFLTIWQSSLLRWKRYEECKQISKYPWLFISTKKTSQKKSLQHTVVEPGGLDGVVSSTKTIRIPRGIPHLKFHGAVVASRQSHGTVQDNEVTYSTKVQNQLGKFRFLELKNAWRFVFFFFGSENRLFGLGEILGSSRSFSGALYDLSRMPWG